MGTNGAGRIHTISPESARRHLENMGLEEDQVFSLMILAETFGNVYVPTYEITDDSWGKWHSLSITHPKGTSEWVIVIDDHYGY